MSCVACVEGKARDKHRQKVKGQVEKVVPEIVFDSCFLGSAGEDIVARLLRWLACSTFSQSLFFV